MKTKFANEKQRNCKCAKKEGKWPNTCLDIPPPTVWCRRLGEKWRGKIRCLLFLTTNCGPIPPPRKRYAFEQRWIDLGHPNFAPLATAVVLSL